MRTSLNASQKVNSLIINYSAKQSNQILSEHPFLAGFSNKPQKHYGNIPFSRYTGMVDVEINEKLRRALDSPAVKGTITCKGKNDKIIKKLSAEDSGQPEVWRSRLFHQDIKRSRSSISAILKADAPTNSGTSTTTTLNGNEESAIQGPIMKVRDSFTLHRKPSNEDDSQVSSAVNVENLESNESLGIKRKGEEPVVYGKWFDFNDDIVTEISCDSFKNVFRGQECAYMLFYRRTSQEATH